MNVVSLFSGIGGLDQGFVEAGFNVIWANDFDKFAAQTYEANNPSGIMHLGDINDYTLSEIPDHDVLIGGFPCQPFSLMGDQLGFNDTRGTLFFRICQIISDKKNKGVAPRVVVLENVRRLLSHDKKRTYKVIKKSLEDLGYTVYERVLNSADFGVPQIRNRLFIVCFLTQDAPFEFPEPSPLMLDMHDILEETVDEKYYLSERLKKTILKDGSGGYSAKSEINQSPARPLCATMAKMHRACQDNYYSDDYICGNGDISHIRKLTPRECARLQGFSDDFIIEVSNAQAYKQFGNAVTVNVSKAVAFQVRNCLEELGEWH